MVLLHEQKIKFSSRIENLIQVEKMVEEISEQMELNKDNFGNIMVAVSEAVTNAIQHGNKNNPEKNVSVNFIPTESYISFIIEDEGTGFDYNSLPDPTLPENIEKPSGRGVYLMKHLADLVNFNNNGSSIELRFYLK
ncbi:MAG: ATP-binding protein [Bacteroidota bacterium]|jgi:serine/threonine-protein kinase RsbW